MTYITPNEMACAAAHPYRVPGWDAARERAAESGPLTRLRQTRSRCVAVAEAHWSATKNTVKKEPVMDATVPRRTLTPRGRLRKLNEKQQAAARYVPDPQTDGWFREQREKLRAEMRRQKEEQ